MKKTEKVKRQRFLQKKIAEKKILKRVQLQKDKSNILDLARAEENPILLPNPENDWEAWQTFNPGVILLENKVHFVYRAIGKDSISRLGYAASTDGFLIDERLSDPIFEHSLTHPAFNYFSFGSGGSFGGSEDPRLVQVDGEDTLYMTYTACDEGIRMALTSIKVEDFLNKKWRWKRPILISPPLEVHKNWVIFPEKINGHYAILHSLSPLVSVAYRNTLDFQEGEYIESYYNGNIENKNCWYNWLKGIGAPPLKTPLGWLIFYHAIDKIEPSKYKIGIMILENNDPTKIIYNSQEPVLEPEEDYENNGFKPGVVYASGAIIKSNELLVYYGASDNYVSVAQANLEEFLKALTQEIKPKFQIKTLKKK